MAPLPERLVRAPGCPLPSRRQTFHAQSPASGVAAALPGGHPSLALGAQAAAVTPGRPAPSLTPLSLSHKPCVLAERPCRTLDPRND